MYYSLNLFIKKSFINQISISQAQFPCTFRKLRLLLIEKVHFKFVIMENQQMKKVDNESILQSDFLQLRKADI